MKIIFTIRATLFIHSFVDLFDENDETSSH